MEDACPTVNAIERLRAALTPGDLERILEMPARD